MTLASDVVNAGKDLLEYVEHTKVPYVNNGSTLKGMDCQGLVEYLLATTGERVSYAGSNDMWRNALTWKGTVEEAVQLGYLVPGAWLFIWKEDGEPSKYENDGMGNASHVGQYLGGTKAVHASSSRGEVAESYIGKKSIKGGWNYVGLCKHIDYSEYISGSVTEEVNGMKATIYAENGASVKVRSEPNTKKPYIAKIAPGTEVEVVNKGETWSSILFNGVVRYIMTEFLKFEGEEVVNTDDAAKEKIKEAIKILESLL